MSGTGSSSTRIVTGDAVQLIQRTRPDLALLDLHMPEKDAVAVVAALGNDAVPPLPDNFRKDTPVIRR